MAGFTVSQFATTDHGLCLISDSAAGGQILAALVVDAGPVVQNTDSLAGADRGAGIPAK